MENWKDIEGFEGYYQISNEGRVKSLERIVIQGNGKKQTVRERILKPLLNSKGYCHVRLIKNGEWEQPFVHQLVAKAFIPNPNCCDVVHHKNHDHKDNRVENLEWMTKLEHDLEHTTEKSKTVYQYTINGKYIQTWSSASEIERILGYNQASILRCCNGGFYRKNRWINTKHAYGYKWSYEPL